MAGLTGNSGGGGLKADINVTPLVDVVLVLLIIFMVVTPMLTRGRNVQLPVATSADPEHETVDAIVLTVTSDKTLWLESRKVTDTELTKELARIVAETPGREVLIKADAGVSVRDLRPVLQKLKRANITQIAFAVLGQKAATQ